MILTEKDICDLKKEIKRIMNSPKEQKRIEAGRSKLISFLREKARARRIKRAYVEEKNMSF